GGPGRPGSATFVTVRLLPTGAPDPAFSGDGLVLIPLGPGTGIGIGAAAVRRGPHGTTLVAGTDLTAHGTPRGAVIRLWPNGALDRRFGSGGVARVARAGRDIHFTAMDGDRRGRIVLAGTARTPDGILVRLRRGGKRDRKFGNGGLTYPVLGRPPGGSPIFTSLNAVDVSGLKPVVVGSAAGPGPLDRTAGGTLYRGSFALTVSRYG
ncbi:MAG TPA: hypothetical protein VFG79_04980, partial [Solirubrobacter sp.]|nr:hypothetical protein [Solirubrobacter sp.]